VTVAATDPWAFDVPHPAVEDSDRERSSGGQDSGFGFVDGAIISDYAAATWYYAGPFCGCGDYSCAAMRNPGSGCSTAAGEFWVDDTDYDAIEGEWTARDTEQENAADAARAAARLTA